MIQAGSLVTFATMPPGADTLPEESLRVFRFCLGRTYRVEEIDRWGMVVLDVSADIDGRFGGFMNDIRVEPAYLLKVSPPSFAASAGDPAHGEDSRSPLSHPMPNPTAPDSLDSRYFDDVYRANPDPWGFTTSPYEAAKYAATLAALPRPLYAAAFEAGCSIGVLTAQLAGRCGRLLSADISERALQAARERCAALDNVRFEQRTLPGEFPDGPFDLIVVSEVGYYLSMPDLLAFRELTINRLAPGGHLLLVHWTPLVHDYPLTGDEVHETFLALAAPDGGRLRHLAGQREEKYRLDLFERA